MQNRLDSPSDDSDQLTKIIVWHQPCEWDASDPDKGIVVTKTQRVVIAGEVTGPNPT